MKTLSPLLVVISLAYTFTYAQSVPEVGSPYSDPVEEYKNNYIQADAYLNTNPKAGMPFAQEALYYASLTKDSLKIAKASYMCGLLSAKIKRFDRSYVFYARAIPAFQFAKNKEFYFNSMWGLGYSLYKLGHFELSASVLEKTSPDILDYLSEEDRFRYYSDLGNVYYFLSDFDAAQSYYLQASNHIEEATDKVAVIQLYHGMVQVYNGQRAQAYYTFEKAITLAEQWQEAATQSLAYHHLARLYQQDGDVLKATELFERSIALADEDPDPAPAIRVRLDLAKLYHAQQQLSMAQQVLTGIEQTANQVPTAPYVYEAFVLMEDICLQQPNCTQLSVYNAGQRPYVDSLAQLAARLTAEAENARLDSLVGDKVRTLLALLEGKEPTTEANAAEVDRPIPWYWVLLLGGAVAIAILFMRLRTTQQLVKAQAAELEKKQNSLNSIKAGAIKLQSNKATRLPDL